MHSLATPQPPPSGTRPGTYGQQKHGGQVVQVVPLTGYVLIDPATESGERLQKKWVSPDRPGRHVVCYTFIRASIVAGALIPPAEMDGVSTVFRDLSRPVEIFLHPALNQQVSQKAAIDIEVSLFF